MLQSLIELSQPESGWKLIVVNNASTDNTLSILKKYQGMLPMVIVEEPRPGKNYALNTALPHLNGDLIIYTDDDVIPDSNWLVNYEKVAQDYPDIDVFAGQVRHHWMKKSPKWLERLGREGRAYAGTPIDLSNGKISARQIKGANFMVRKHLLDDYKYKEGVGPDGTQKYAGGSETEFLIRLEGAGSIMYYLSEAVVLHIVKDYQIGIRPILNRYFRIGRGMQKVTGIDRITEDTVSLLGYPRYVLREAVGLAFQSLVYLFKLNTYMFVNKLMDASVKVGMAYEWRSNKKRD